MDDTKYKIEMMYEQVHHTKLTTWALNSQNALLWKEVYAVLNVERQIFKYSQEPRWSLHQLVGKEFTCV